jgi:3-oxoacyl-[acyl-carrier protein] reductase
MNNQAAIITGAGTGIGFEIALQLALRGVKVSVNDMDEALASVACQKITSRGGVCLPIVGDASDPIFIKALVEKTVESFGTLNMVIANAGITTFGRFIDYTSSDFDRLVALNLKGSFFLAQAAAKQMITQRQGGRILLMSSVTGVQAHENLVAYGMTKGALQMLAKGLVVELAKYQITINTIAPGATLTERTTGDAAYEATWSSITPNGRPATTTDVANAALFFLAPEASHITGQTLVVDGGWTSVSPSPYHVIIR